MVTVVDYAFIGKGKWMHRLFEEDAEYNYYGLDLYPDKASLKAFVLSGSMGKVSEDKETGEEFIRLRRKPKSVSRKGKVVDWGPPKVYDADGSVWPSDKIIGNGSTVECRVSVVLYSDSKFVTTRLDSVKVLDWKEYIPQDPAMDEAA